MGAPSRWVVAPRPGELEGEEAGTTRERSSVNGWKTEERCESGPGGETRYPEMDETGGTGGVYNIFEDSDKALVRSNPCPRL